MSEKTLKTANYGVIGIVATGAIWLGYHAFFQPALPDAGGEAIAHALGAGAAAVIAMLLGELISGGAKARLIFLKWHQALPGHEAFTVHVHEDKAGRIDKAKLTRRQGAFPTEPRAQNAMWYGMLKRNGDAPEVAHAHQRYLLLRDMTWVTLELFGLAVLVALRLGIESAPRLVFLGALLVFAVLLRWMAAGAGRNLVKTVLAIESHRED